MSALVSKACLLRFYNNKYSVNPAVAHGVDSVALNFLARSAPGLPLADGQSILAVEPIDAIDT